MTDCRKGGGEGFAGGQGGGAQALLPRGCARFSREGTRHGGTGTRYLLAGPNGRTEPTDKASATHLSPGMYAYACEAGTVSAAQRRCAEQTGQIRLLPCFRSAVRKRRQQHQLQKQAATVRGGAAAGERRRRRGTRTEAEAEAAEAEAADRQSANAGEAQCVM